MLIQDNAAKGYKIGIAVEYKKAKKTEFKAKA